MEKIKTIIFWVVVGAAGYFGYQYFIGSSPQEPAFNVHSLPMQCQDSAKTLEEAVARREISATINGYTKTLRQCLRESGLSQSEIEDVAKKIRGNR